jgi:hypothetical protein
LSQGFLTSLAACKAFTISGETLSILIETNPTSLAKVSVAAAALDALV